MGEIAHTTGRLTVQIFVLIKQLNSGEFIHVANNGKFIIKKK